MHKMNLKKNITDSLQMSKIASKNKDPNNKSISLIEGTNDGKKTNKGHQAVSRNDDEGYQE